VKSRPADSQRSNTPYRIALGLRVAEAHALTQAGNVALPQFYSARPPYVASARGDPGLVGGPGWWQGATGAAINAGYFENLRELSIGTAAPAFMRHYYQGAKQQ
jgi:hypothetical protein